ncbi:hypothetical protein SASPL_145067 [Salvia splendens]|uniref:Disease resistance protein RPM1 n=1 Tax=Salvia splendens TaxID=180675 RepID=A0A8X8Z7C8_SALSN|nr:hypothetical protein SASPL_145067 [Salvia splendens]
MQGGSAAIEVVVQNLINVLMEEYFLVQGLNENAKKLQMTLGMIQAYLNDAEKKFIPQDSVKFWLRKLEALAFDADNVLDELSYQLLHKQVEKMKTLNPSPKAKLKLLSRFSSFNRISHLGLQSIVRYAPAVVVPTSTGTNSIKSDPIFVGRDVDVSNVVDMLTRIPQDQTISIVALVGYGEYHGLPLAANVAGGVLRCRESERDWRSIKENWLPDGEGGEDISIILKLSYDHLSSLSLKKCFAYCSIFPKGRGIVKEELIELWMAEGFLQPIGGDDMESVGNIYFNVLLQYSLLLATQANYGWECFVMHDFVHDLASSVLYTTNTHSSTIVRYKFHENQSCRISEEVLRNLRTLLLRGGTSSTIFSNFKCLHNLTLYGRDYKELPISIKELIHLRNLNISGTSIVNIPER